MGDSGKMYGKAGKCEKGAVMLRYERRDTTEKEGRKSVERKESEYGKIKGRGLRSGGMLLIKKNDHL